MVGAFGFQLCMAHRNYHSGCVEKAMGSIIARNESRTFNQILMSMVQNALVVSDMKQYTGDEVIQSLVDAAVDGFNFSNTGPLLQLRHNKFCSWCANAFSVFSDAECNEHGTDNDTEDEHIEHINCDNRM